MAIKINNNSQTTITVKIKKDLNSKIDTSLNKIEEIAGVKLYKNDLINQLLEYALNNETIIINDKEMTFDELLGINKNTEVQVTE